MHVFVTVETDLQSGAQYKYEVRYNRFNIYFLELELLCLNLQFALSGVFFLNESTALINQNKQTSFVGVVNKRLFYISNCKNAEIVVWNSLDLNLC